MIFSLSTICTPNLLDCKSLKPVHLAGSLRFQFSHTSVTSCQLCLQLPQFNEEFRPKLEIAQRSIGVKKKGRTNAENNAQPLVWPVA